MEWMFDRRGKSVAQSAQRVVADMHRHLEQQSKKVQELESIIAEFNKLFTDSLEDDLLRLEERKKELQEELESVDSAIHERRSRLEALRSEISRIITQSKVASKKETSEEHASHPPSVSSMMMVSLY
jgi:chromosome segregation ATPase